MEVTGVKIRKLDSGALRGVAEITLNNSLVIHEIRIIESKKDGKLFLSMPSRKTPEGAIKDICHPINNELRTLITDAVLEAYVKEY